MKIEADNVVAFPREVCFATYRDRLVELVPYLPNVSGITVKQREQPFQGSPKKVRLVNEWRAVSEIPKVAAALIKPEMLAWEDTAIWDEESWVCHWSVATHFFSDRVRCEGTNEFIPQGDRTLFRIRGDLDIRLGGLPGVPRLLGDKVGSLVERFVVALLTPNLTSISTGLERFLRAERTEAKSAPGKEPA